MVVTRQCMINGGILRGGSFYADQSCECENFYSSTFCEYNNTLLSLIFLAAKHSAV